MDADDWGSDHRNGVQPLCPAQGDEDREQETDIDLVEVQVQKDPSKPLGITIKVDSNHYLVIGRMLCGGVCSQSGQLKEGDRLILVNDISLTDKSLSEACEILQNLSGRVTFHIKRGPDNPLPAQVTGGLTLRALYCYNPMEDYMNPCKEASLTFNRGDIIRVVCREDQDWWQGYLDNGETGQQTGIFPSPAFQQRNGLESPQRRPYYERQGRLLPQPLRRRPLVLVGPPGVGVHELRVRLIEFEPGRFAPAVSHTTRQQNSEEQDGMDYWFVDRSEFQRLKSQGVFIETGLFNGDFYGTSVTSVQKVVDAGMVCVLTLQPESLQALRTHPSLLMPYAVFVSQPSASRLRELRRRLEEQSEQTFNFTDRQLRNIVAMGNRMRESHGHLFDFVLEPTDLEAGHGQLVELISRLQSDQSQWVPESWLRTGPPEPGQLSDTEF